MYLCHVPQKVQFVTFLFMNMDEEVMRVIFERKALFQRLIPSRRLGDMIVGSRHVLVTGTIVFLGRYAGFTF